jgi:hypothetical protein
MIHDLDLPMFIWVETCTTTIYIHNRCPHKILGDKTLEEEFTRVNPKASHFCVFGCLVYIHVSVDKRSELEPSSRECLFVGYNETSNTYKVYTMEYRKTIVRRDVNFEEDFASMKSHEPTPVAKDEEHESLKVELGSLVISREVQQLSSEEGEMVSPSTYVKRPPWFSKKLRDAQENVESLRSTFKERKPMNTFSYYMALMSNIQYSNPSSFQEEKN